MTRRAWRSTVKEVAHGRWILRGTLLLVVALSLPPAVIGWIAERDLVHLVARFQDASMRVAITHYSRGLFRAEAVLEIRNEGSAPIVMRLDVRHGPLLPRSTCGRTLGLAVAAGEILPAEENVELVRLFGRDPIPVLCVYSDLGGDGLIEVVVPAHGTTDLLATGDLREFAWGRTVLRLYEIDQGLRVVLNAPRLEYSQLFEVGRIGADRPLYGQWDYRFDGVTLNQIITTGADRTHAQSELSVATINATRTEYEPESFSEVQELKLVSQTDEVDGILDWSGRVAWGALIVPNWHASAGEIPVQLLNVDAGALRDLNLALTRSERESALNRLIELGPVFRLGPASQRSAGGELQLDVTAEIQPGPLSMETGPARLVQRIRGHFDLSLPVGFVYGLVRERYEDQAARDAVARGMRVTTFQVSRLAEQRFDSDLARIARRGLLRREDGTLRTDMTLADGLISSEGQAEPLLDLIEWLGLILRTQMEEVDT
jgi:uncharacterized protein DUF945